MSPAAFAETGDIEAAIRAESQAIDLIRAVSIKKHYLLSLQSIVESLRRACLAPRINSGRKQMGLFTQIAKSPLNFRCLLALVALSSCPVAQAGVVALPGPNIGGEADYLGIHDARGDVKGKFQEGLDLLKAGKCKKAQENLGFVLKQADGDANVQFLQGMAFRCEKLHDKAARQFRKAIRTNRGLHVAYKYLAFSYLDLEKRKKAGKILFKLDRLRERCGGQCPDTLLAAHTSLAAEIKRRQPK